MPSSQFFSHTLKNINGSLRSKRFQSSFSAKVGAGAKKQNGRGRGRGEEEKLSSPYPYEESLSPLPSPSFPFFCSHPNVLDELARKRLLRRLYKWL